jgi:glucose dehydrogenase
MAITASVSPHPLRRLARIVFFTFVLVFTASRVLVILIMTRKIPDLFLNVGQTHVHHLNYGIFLLSTVGAVLLFAPLSDRQKQWMACAYGFGMALTFDEFGMWLHLGGSYWQRASYDAVIVVAGILGLVSFAPRWSRLGPRHYVAAGATLVALAVFCGLSYASLNFVDKKMGDRLRTMEVQGPR